MIRTYGRNSTNPNGNFFQVAGFLNRGKTRLKIFICGKGKIEPIQFTIDAQQGRMLARFLLDDDDRKSLTETLLDAVRKA